MPPPLHMQRMRSSSFKVGAVPTRTARPGYRPWTATEDAYLMKRLEEVPLAIRKGKRTTRITNWAQISKGLDRTAKQVRERLIGPLSPTRKVGEWTAEEDSTIELAYSLVGPKWNKIAAELEGRTDGQVRKRFDTLQKQKLQGTKKSEAKGAVEVFNFFDAMHSLGSMEHFEAMQSPGDVLELLGSMPELPSIDDFPQLAMPGPELELELGLQPEPEPEPVAVRPGGLYIKHVPVGSIRRYEGARFYCTVPDGAARKKHEAEGNFRVMTALLQ